MLVATDIDDNEEPEQFPFSLSCPGLNAPVESSDWLKKAYDLTLHDPTPFRPAFMGIEKIRDVLDGFSEEVETVAGVPPDVILAALWALSTTSMMDSRDDPLVDLQLWKAGYRPISSSGEKYDDFLQRHARWFAVRCPVRTGCGEGLPAPTPLGVDGRYCSRRVRGVANSGRIARPRLAAHARAALGRGSLLLTAGAGYGKSMVLEEALSETTPTPAWVPCTPADRDANRLLSHILEAISRVLPGAADILAEQLRLSPERVDATAGARALLAELENLLVEPLTLVLDDGEQLADAPEALAVVAELLRAPRRAALRVALAARRSLGLPLAKPVGAGRIEELDAAELAFDAAECAECLRLHGGTEPQASDVDAVFDQTEGWPLAVAAVAIAAARRESSPAKILPARHRGSAGGAASLPELREFLIEEVLDTLDARRRRALLDSAVASQLTPEIVAALELPDDFVADLQRSGLFLRRIDQARDAFAFNPLFRQYLLERLAAEREDAEVAALHARVAAVLGEAGEPVEAIAHWLAAGDFPAAAGAIERFGDALRASSPQLLREWVDQLPTEERARPSMRVLEGQLAFDAGDDRRGEALLREALADGRLRENPAREWLARFALSFMLFFTGEFDEAAKIGSGFDAPRARQAGPIAATTGVVAAICLAAAGRTEESDRVAEVALRQGESEALAPFDAVRREYVETPAGQGGAVLSRLKQVLASLERSDPFMYRLYVISAIAGVLTEQGRFEEALDWRRRFVAEAEAGLQSRVVASARVWHALLLAQMGRTQEGSAELARAGAPEPGWRGHAEALVRATLCAERGDRAGTLAATEDTLERVASAPIPWRSRAAADLVPVLAKVGAAARARELLAEASALVERSYPPGGGRFLLARLFALGAWLDHRDGDESAAGTGLERLLEHAGGAAPDVLRREWPRLEELVWHALERESVAPEPMLRLLERAFPDGLALVPLIEHPNPYVRRAALGPALASGHPSVAQALSSLLADPDPTVAAMARTARGSLAASAPPLVFTLLGGFAVRRGSWRIESDAFDRPGAVRLLRLLLVEGGAPIAEDMIFEALWPGAPPQRARRSLQVSVSRVRAVLDHPAADESVLELHGGAYTLRLAEADIVDSAQFEAAAAAALRSEPPSRALLEQVQRLWTGEPLPEDRYEDWSIAWRERLTECYLEVLSALVSAYVAERDHPRAIACASELVGLDPLNEAAHRELMAAYARAGRPAHALRQYLACRRALVEDAGIEPAAQTSRLQERILAGEAV